MEPLHPASRGDDGGSPAGHGPASRLPSVAALAGYGAEAVRDAAGLREANAVLTRMGVRTELEYELSLAR